MKTKFALVLATMLTGSLPAQVLPPDAIVGDKTLSEWTAEWFKWTWLSPTNTHPSFDPDGRWATNGQPDGPVFFLTGVFAGLGSSTTSTRSFSVPEGRYLFFPLSAVYVENIDTVPPLSVGELRDIASAIISTVSELHASIDGVPVPNLFQYRLVSPVYSYVLPDANNLKTVLYGHPVTGLLDPEIADGYWLMVEPLPPGVHVLNWGGTLDLFDYVQDNTAIIRVVPAPLSQRVQELIASVGAASLPKNNTHPLLEKLVAAGKAFDRGHLSSGIHHLRAFQNKIRHEIARSDSALADQFIEAAQTIVNRAIQELGGDTPLPPVILPNDAVVDGKSIGEWTADWWKWIWLLPTNNHPWLDPDGRWATNAQPEGPVLFVVGALAGVGIPSVETRAFTIPEGKYLLFGLANVAPENIDTIPPLTAEELRTLGDSVIATVTELHATIDGIPEPNLFQRRIMSPVYNYVLPDANNFKSVFYGHPISGLIDPEVSDGYWIMVGPLSPGTHVINWGSTFGAAPLDFRMDITDIITVVPVPLEQRVEELLAKVEASSLSGKWKRVLETTLLKARADFEKGNLRGGIRHLTVFQHKVRSQLARTHPELAEDFIGDAQAIIDRAKQDLLAGHRDDDNSRPPVPGEEEEGEAG